MTYYGPPACEKLLRKFLVRDPTKRNSLDFLIDDPWINEGYPDSPIVKDVSTRVEEDESIINLMVSKYHIDRDTVTRSIRENQYDDVAAIYYLAYYEKQAKGEISMSPTTESGPPPPLVGGKLKETEPSKTPAGMHRIAEDEVLPALPSNGTPKAAPTASATAAANAAARKRRFTVGNDKDVQNMADEENDPEAKEVLKKLQALQNPAKPSEAKKEAPPASGLPAGVDVDAVVAAAVAKTGTPDSANTADGGRHRNTIGGFFRNHIRRATETGTPSSAGGPALSDSADDAIIENSSTNDGIPGAKPRSLRFTFNSNTTSSRPPDEIIQEVLSICDKLDVKHRMSSRYVVECTFNANAEEAVKFEVEVCKLPRLKNLHGLRFKRIGGDSNEYKEICEKILAEVKL
ncbi:Map microtubule affinity-regulating kinase [Gonapodya sp. JEL0774]|nr:Map microtubule affinity-regulating kinase [Gonapodya sp. JEL0774]